MLDRGYVDAYRWFAGLTLLAATVALIWLIVTSNDDVAILELSWAGVMSIFWTLEGLALTLPSIVLALRESDRT